MLIAGGCPLIDLAVRRCTHVKALASVPCLADGIGPRTDALRLERLDGPGIAHFPGNHALDIVLDIHDVDHIDVAAGHALVFKAAVIAVAAEPRHRLLPRFDRQDAQRVQTAAVKTEEHRIGARDENLHACAAGADHAGRRVIAVPRSFRLTRRGIGADAHAVASHHIGRIAAAAVRRRARLVKVRILLIEFNGVGRVRCHRDFFTLAANISKLRKFARGIIVPERIAVKVGIVLQVRR